MTARRAGRALVVVVAVLSVTACSSQVRRQEAVQRIADAADARAIRTGRLTISSTAPDFGMPAPAGLPVPPRASVALDVVLDPARQRAALLAPAALAARIGPTSTGARPALALFAGHTRFVRSADIGAIGARPWYRVAAKDVGALSEPSTNDLQKPPTLGALAVVSPLAIVEACHGVLTGSVSIRAADSGTHYDARTSADKVARSLRRDPTSVRPLQHALRAFAARDDINDIAVWRASDGSLARIRLTYAQRPEKGVKATITYDLTLDPRAPRVDTTALVLPRGDDVVDVTGLGDLRASLDQLATMAMDVRA